MTDTDRDAYDNLGRTVTINTTASAPLTFRTGTPPLTPDTCYANAARALDSVGDPQRAEAAHAWLALAHQLSDRGPSEPITESALRTATLDGLTGLARMYPRAFAAAVHAFIGQTLAAEDQTAATLLELRAEGQRLRAEGRELRRRGDDLAAAVTDGVRLCSVDETPTDTPDATTYESLARLEALLDSQRRATDAATSRAADTRAELRHTTAALDRLADHLRSMQPGVVLHVPADAADAAIDSLRVMEARIGAMRSVGRELIHAVRRQIPQGPSIHATADQLRELIDPPADTAATVATDAAATIAAVNAEEDPAAATWRKAMRDYATRSRIGRAR